MSPRIRKRQVVLVYFLPLSPTRPLPSLSFEALQECGTVHCTLECVCDLFLLKQYTTHYHLHQNVERRFKGGEVKTTAANKQRMNKKHHISTPFSTRMGW